MHKNLFQRMPKNEVEKRIHECKTYSHADESKYKRFLRGRDKSACLKMEQVLLGHSKLFFRVHQDFSDLVML